MADDDYSDFAPANPEADVAQLEGSDYSEFIPEASPQGGPIRVMSEWVPGERRTYDTQHGPDGRSLVFGSSAAVSPNLAQGHQLHEPFEVYRNGKSLGRYSYDDASYYSPGRPTTNTIERYGLPDLGRADQIKWLGSGGARDDYSGFIAENQQPAAQDDYSGFKPASEAVAPAEQQPAQPEQKGFDLGKSVQNIWDVANAAAAKMHYGAAQATVNQPQSPNDDYEQAIQEAQSNPSLTPEQRDQYISDMRANQQKARDREQLAVQPAQEAMQQAEAKVTQDKPNAVESIIGGTAPYVASGFAGPLGPFAAATQATAQAYGQTLDDAAKLAKQNHPDWDDGRIALEANKAATDSAKASGESMLALGLVDIPVAGPLITRIAARIGIGSFTMEAANIYAEVQRDIALKATVNPQQDIYERLRDLDFHLQNLATGGAFALPHALGEIGRGERGGVEAPAEQPTPEAKPEQQPTEPSQKAATVEENGETAEQPQPVAEEPRAEPQQPEQPIEQPQPEQKQEEPEPEPDWNVPADWDQQRQEYERELRGEAQGAQSELLSGVQRAGGLPTPGAVKKGDYFLAAEIQRVQDAWKSLDQDSKNWLKKQGVMPSKLFRNDAPGVDEMRGRLEQHPGLSYEQPAELLDDIEEAIRSARDRKLKFGERYAAEPAEMYSGLSPKAILKAAEPIEHLYLPNREVVAKQPHTGELINALDEFRAREGELHGQVAQLSNLFKTLRKSNPNLDKEVDQIGRYAEQNRALPAQMSPEAKQWLQAANNGLYRQIGDRMRAGGFKVVNPDGTTRPFIGAPRDVTPLPRVMRPDVERVLQGPLLDNNGNFTPEAQKLYQEGVNAGYFQKPEDLTQWARQYRMDHAEKPNITNLERARTSKYPGFFYTYSPQAMLDRLFWQSTELARLESFGQKLPGQSDLFDKTAEKINGDMTLGNDRKQPAFNAIEALRRTVYGQNKRSWGIRLLRGASSAGLAGSPHTSAKIGLSMLFNIPQYRGLGRTLTGILDTAVHPVQTYAELRRLGLSQETLINIHDDPYSVQTAERRASNIFTGILKIAGHSLVQDIGKSVTMRVSKSWIERASQILQSDPQMKSSLARQVAEDIRRRGVDPAQFASGNVSQALKDRFVREDVNDLQTAYRPEDYPAWQASGMGSVMFQFGHWAYNGARAITRDAVMPMVRAYDRGDYMLSGRYLGRLVGLSLAAAGAAEAWRKLDELFGRQPAVATIGEITKAYIRNNPESAHMLTARLMEDILTSPVLGTFGDIANLGRNVTRGAAGETHFFNPASPAAVGYLSIVANAVNMAFQQGGHLSMRQTANIASQLASLGKGYYDVANSLGAAASQITGAKPSEIPLPGHAEAMGRRENTFVKSRLDLFYTMHPELDKRQKGGTMAGNTHTPYLQDLNEELLAGNGVEARRIAYTMKKDLGLTDKQWKTSLSESINGHRPIPTGTAGDAFMQWAPRSLTPEELQRMRRIERVYESTAQRAGLPVKQQE